MDDSPHASHWQQAAAAGEALAVTAAIAAAVFLLFDNASGMPLPTPGAAGVAAAAPCDDGARAAADGVAARTPGLGAR